MIPTVRTVHRLSGAILIAFVLIHLANHLAGLGGTETHRAFMAVARLTYRAPVVEPLLLAAVMAQVLTGGIQLWAARRHAGDAWGRMQVVSGAYLMFYLVNHTLSVLLARSQVDSDFYLAAAVLTVQPLPIFFVPYYGLGILALFVHLACAAHFHRLGGTDKVAKGLVTAGVLIAPVIVGVFAGAFYEIELPAAYRDLVARYSPWG